MLDVSEPTMKRWLRAQGLLLKDWSKMLKVLELSPLDVLSKANIIQKSQFEYSEKQEESFVKIPGLLAFFQQITEGLNAEQIASKFRLNSASVVFYLKKLDEIGLIRWGTAWTFSILKSGEPKWRKNGALSLAFRTQVFNELIYNNKNSEKLRLAIYRLSLSDIAKLQEMLADVFEFAKQAESRSKYMANRSKTIGLAVLNSEYQPDFLYSIPNKK